MTALTNAERQARYRKGRGKFEADGWSMALRRRGEFCELSVTIDGVNRTVSVRGDCDWRSALAALEVLASSMKRALDN